MDFRIPTFKQLSNFSYRVISHVDHTPQLSYTQSAPHSTWCRQTWQGQEQQKCKHRSRVSQVSQVSSVEEAEQVDSQTLHCLALTGYSRNNLQFP